MARHFNKDKEFGVLPKFQLCNYSVFLNTRNIGDSSCLSLLIIWRAAVLLTHSFPAVTASLLPQVFTHCFPLALLCEVCKALCDLPV